jgi:FMN phosphatase YigB (HAD superfamily)
MAIKGIFFDAAGVLYHRPESTGSYVSKLLKERGLPVELSAQVRVRQKALRSKANKGRLSPTEYWDQLLLMYNVVDPAERQWLVSKIDDFSDSVFPLPGSQEALAVLKQRGFVLGIITDTIYPIERKQRWLDIIGIAEFIDVLACSSDLGVHKPHPAIYLHALQQAYLPPAEAAFVGHATDELDGAHLAGLATVAVFYEPGAKADYYAESLVDLLNVPIFHHTYPER